MTAKKGRDFVQYEEEQLGEDAAIEFFNSLGIKGLIFNGGGYSEKITNLVIYDSNIKHFSKRNDETIENIHYYCIFENQ